MHDLIWLDCEMTGLDPAHDTILEIAVIITDHHLNIVAYGPHYIIATPQYVLDSMNEWCKIQHALSGLTQACLQSSSSIQEAQQAIVGFLNQHLKGSKGILCGNSIWQDRMFLMHSMPEILDLLDYRMIDVSSFKEILRRWYPKNPKTIYQKNDTHRAFNDIIESIQQLAQYRKIFFINQ